MDWKVERFPVLETYADSIRTLAQGNKRLAEELSYRVIQYGIYWTPPGDEVDAIVKALFIQFQHPIDNGRKQILNGCKWGRPIKDWNNSQKPKPNPNLTQDKPNPNPNETKIKNKKEKIKKEINKEKTLFWDYVSLSTDEYSKLKEIFWEKRLRQIINEVDNSIWMHWYKYESHYRVILKWYAKEIEDLRNKVVKQTSLPDYDTLDPILMS